MEMNRQQRRMLQKQGELGPDGEPARQRRAAPQQARSADDRATAAEFVKEVRAELRKVAWPSREETINYTTVVLITLVLITALIFCLDWVFAKGTEALFSP